MIISSTLHNHCDMCDGRSSAEEMIEAAIAAGFTDFGMSCHSYAPFDIDYSIKDEAAYLAALSGLRQEYEGRIRIAIGSEQDLFAPVQYPEAYDYIIGSVHYLKDGHGSYHAVDSNLVEMLGTLDEVYDGNAMAAIADYYENVVMVAKEQRPDIIGHFDVIKKTNGEGAWFSEDDPIYQKLALDAIRRTAKNGAVFEVNTTPLFKKLKIDVYPSPFLLRELLRLGADVMINTDAHCTQQITYGVDQTAELLKDIGFRRVLMWQKGGFVSKRL